MIILIKNVFMLVLSLYTYSDHIKIPGDYSLSP